MTEELKSCLATQARVESKEFRAWLERMHEPFLVHRKLWEYGFIAQALFERTAKLPRVELTRPPSVIGRNTAHSIQSGLLFGYVGLVEGMVARFKAELGPQTRIIATGGLAEIIARETSVIDIVDPWLTLHGLRIIYELNEQ